MRRCLRRALETRSPAEVEVRKFKLTPAKSPVILTVEPIVTTERVLAFGVRAEVRARPNRGRRFSGHFAVR